MGASFPEWARTWFLVALAVIGMGMGPTSISFILAVQHAVSWGQRGVATGAAIFLRTIGGSTGVGVLGRPTRLGADASAGSLGIGRDRRHRRAAARDPSSI